MPTSSNFNFLAEHDPVFLQLATAAEQVFAADPNTTLIKLRQLGEALAQDVAARAGVQFDAETSQSDLLFRLNREIKLDPTVTNPAPERKSAYRAHHAPQQHCIAA